MGDWCARLKGLNRPFLAYRPSEARTAIGARSVRPLGYHDEGVIMPTAIPAKSIKM